MEERLPRKLVAILYADVAGYSRLTGDDEDATQGMPFWQSSIPSSMHCHRISLSKTNSKIVIKICPTNARYSFESATIARCRRPNRARAHALRTPRPARRAHRPTASTPSPLPRHPRPRVPVGCNARLRALLTAYAGQPLPAASEPLSPRPTPRVSNPDEPASRSPAS